MVATEIVGQIAGVAGCGGGSFQLSYFAGNFVASTPIGSKTCFVGDSFTSFRNAFTHKSEQEFVQSFSVAYEDRLKDVSAKFYAQGGKRFTGKFVAMSGLS